MKFIAFFISISICSASFAEKFCFKDAAGHASVKDKLPDLFKTVPIVLGGEKPGALFDIIALVKIYFNGNTIVMTSDVWKPPGRRVNDTGEVQEICYDTGDKSFVINFKNDAEPFKTVYNNGVVVVSGVTLKSKSSAEQLELLYKLEVKQDPSKAGVKK